MPPMKPPFQTALLLALPSLLVSCTPKPAPPPAPVAEVVTVTVARQSVRLTTELPGRTAPFLIAEIRPQVSGLIQKRLFTEGSDVREGDVLYQIDPAPFQAALDNALAALGRADASLPALQSRVDRFRQALVDRAVSQQDADDAEAALQQARADVAYWKAMVETARINLGYARVVSPISGRIGRSTVTEGAIVTAYQPVALASIQQLDPIYVDVPQSTTELLRLRRRLEDRQWSRGGTNENQVELILAEGTVYEPKGTLQFRDVSVDPTTASVTLRMVFPNPHGVLLPGMFVRAVVEEGASDRAILIPQQAVARDPKGQPLAWVVVGKDRVERRQLGLDRALGDRWLVASGLEPGDRVVVEGMQRLRDDAPVHVVTPTGEARPESGPAKPAPAPAKPNP